MSASEGVIRVRGAAEQIAVLPHQLGYQPRQSLVVTLLGEPRSDGGPLTAAVLMTMRFDIPEPNVVNRVVEEVRAVCAREQPGAAQIFAYTDEREDAHAVRSLRLFGQACADEGAAVDTLAQVSDGFWCRRTHLGEHDCPPTWARIPALADVPAAADLVFRGASPLGDRAELGRALDADCPLTHQAVRQALRLHDEDPEGPFGDVDGPRREGDLQAWEDRELRHYRTWALVLRTDPDAPAIEQLGTEDLVATVRSLRYRVFRDCLLELIAPSQFSDLDSSAPNRVQAALVRVERRCLAEAVEEEARGRGLAAPPPIDLDLLTPRLTTLCARTPREHAVPVLSLLGMHAWSKGAGTLANLAVERALAVDPDYRLAQLLDLALTAALRPRRFTREAADRCEGRGPDAA
ncbi:DUF4192 family protein [Ornithinicoccus hortensis]|uniref:Uncharacterized protein DUF4192 n=1 Tax=Ornithinicoccus hortensis TaxID=82346 RepID=A0A542YR03_9MICO|nr:DUF4192 family protein [Ornithinicoccus hortensis]TQL50523.1 uncharacterized protein DUF4192 [Ornithinicoccus hortensis]